MTRRLSVAPEAEAELQSAALGYGSKRPGLGVEFVVALDDAFERIFGTPEASPMWLPGRPFRRHVVARFPYVIFFWVSGESIEERGGPRQTATGALARSLNGAGVARHGAGADYAPATIQALLLIGRWVAVAHGRWCATIAENQAAEPKRIDYAATRSPL